MPAKVIGPVTPAIRSRGGGSLGASTISRGIVRVGSDVRRRGVLANVLDGHKSSDDKPAVTGDILVTIQMDVAHLATGVADGLGVGLGLPTRVSAALLSEARSRDARGVGSGRIARVVVGSRVILVSVSVVPVIVAEERLLLLELRESLFSLRWLEGFWSQRCWLRISTALWIVSGYCSLPREYCVCKVVMSEPYLALETDRRNR